MIKLVTSYEDFKALRDNWNLLLDLSANADNVFLRHEWFDCWWKAFGETQRLFILLYWKENNLEGIAAFMIFRDTYKVLPFKRLNFIEDPNAPCMDFIIKQGKEIEILESFINFIFNRKIFWNIAIFSKISEKSPIAQILPNILKKKKISFDIRIVQNSPYIQILSDWDSFWKNTSQRFKKRLRNNFNRLEKAGELTFDQVTDISKAPWALEEAFKVAAKSWKAKYGTVMDSTPQRMRFFTNLSKIASENGWLSLWFLKLNGKSIAIEYHLKYRGLTHAMRGDFDETYEYLSPGRALEAHIIKHCFQNNLKEYDFCGLDYSYKLHWKPFLRKQIRFLIYNNNSYSQLLYILQKYLPRFRKIIDPLIKRLVHVKKKAT